MTFFSKCRGRVYHQILALESSRLVTFMGDFNYFYARLYATLPIIRKAAETTLLPHFPPTGTNPPCSKSIANS